MLFAGAGMTGLELLLQVLKWSQEDKVALANAQTRVTVNTSLFSA